MNHCRFAARKMFRQIPFKLDLLTRWLELQLQRQQQQQQQYDH